MGDEPKQLGIDLEPLILNIRPIRELSATQLAQAAAIPAKALCNPINSPPYEARFDKERLTGQAKAVYELMKAGGWWTLSELNARVNGTETGIAATVRSFRKEQFGSHTVNRRRRGDPKKGLWEYQLITK